MGDTGLDEVDTTMMQGQYVDDVQTPGGFTPQGFDQQIHVELTTEEKLGYAEEAIRKFHEIVSNLQMENGMLEEDNRVLYHTKLNLEAIIQNIMERFDVGDVRIRQTAPDGSIVTGKALAWKEATQLTFMENLELRKLLQDYRKDIEDLQKLNAQLMDMKNKETLQLTKENKELRRLLDEANATRSDLAWPTVDSNGPPAGSRRQPSIAGVNDFMDSGASKSRGDNPWMTEEAQAVHDAREQEKHERRRSSIAPPTSLFDENYTGPRELTEEERQVQEERELKHKARESVNLDYKQIYGKGEFDSDEDNPTDATGRPLTADEVAKRAERGHHKRVSSVPTPQIFEMDEEDGARESDDGDNEDTGTKRRGSKAYMDDNDHKIRAERQQKAHQPKMSFDTQAGAFMRSQMKNDSDTSSDDEEPPVQGTKKRGSAENIMALANTAEAKQIRDDRARKHEEHMRNLSQLEIIPNLFDSGGATAPVSKKMAHARKMSIKEQLNGKTHLSDEDIDTTLDYEMRTSRAKKIEKKRRKHKRKISMKASDLQRTDRGGIHNRGTSELPEVDLGLGGDSDKETKGGGTGVGASAGGGVGAGGGSSSLASAGPELKKTKEDLERKILELRQMTEEKVRKESEISQLKRELESSKLDFDSKFSKKKIECDSLRAQIRVAEEQFGESVQSKVKLVEYTGAEINRLTRVINALLSIPKCKEITRLLLDESLTS